MKHLWLLCLIGMSYGAFAQQVADTTYMPKISSVRYASGKGPVVFIDEGHHNFHTKDGRYKAFSKLLERDGYRVEAYTGNFKAKPLSEGEILVISNALHERNVLDWTLPNPSAFSSTEIELVEEWVHAGGSLFLIADHMPMAGAAADLAKKFGFEFTNGFVFDTINPGPAYFSLKEKTLTESRITQGRNAEEGVEQIATFTGQAFKIPDDATAILTFPENYVNMLPEKAWEFNDKTTKFNVEGWSQGAYKPHGKGKVVVFGEAAMFSAQWAGKAKRKMGMNNEVAPENYQLLLNIMHWLDGTLD